MRLCFSKGPLLICQVIFSKLAIAKRLWCAGSDMWFDSKLVLSFLAVSLEKGANELVGESDQHMVPPGTGAR